MGRGQRQEGQPESASFVEVIRSTGKSVRLDSVFLAAIRPVTSVQSSRQAILESVGGDIAVGRAADRAGDVDRVADAKNRRVRDR